MTAAKGVALAAALSLGLAACGSSEEPTDESTADEMAEGESSADPLVIGTTLPVTGTLSFLGPPEIAGVGLAVSDINEAGGVLGNEVTVEWGDSGDNTDATVANSTATDHISQGVDAVIGAASSSVTLGVVDTYVEAGIMMISPANTSAELSDYSEFYTRTAPPDTVQGAALGSLILEGGHTDVAMIVLNDSYGTGLRDHTQSAIEAGGGTVVYGASGEGQEFPPGETNFGSQVSAALATDPDALVLIAFEETTAAVNELVAQGWDFDGTTYFTDGNLSNGYEFDEGTLAGVQGTLPGAQADDDLRERLNTWYSENEGGELDGYSYSAESYDATILAALAAVRGGDTSGQAIADNIKAVSGAEGGTEVTTFAEGVEALEAGDEINYTGPSGTGPLNEMNDPSSAFIGIYEYGDDNQYEYVRQIEGTTAE
ncbi:ABC transporter substrate-binding protein [Isoptericola chiayiensis]|nr:ABC transporter substrate-binding protein [Isoptericola chiayiensis]NOW02199.1 branched-chain amino acid transport system substrate-binding protein [Isoptericola chiayiensis]